MTLNNPIQITLPASKSLSNRWLVLDFMSCNGIRIKNLSNAEDTQLLKRLLRQLKMGRRHNFDCHDAGTAARFLAPILAFTPGQNLLTGSERLCQRPMVDLIEALRSMGCKITCTGEEGHLPIKIDGIRPFTNRVKIDGSESSQYVSALLLSALMLPQGLAIEVTGTLTSEPYINMTLRTLADAHVECSYKGIPPAFHVEHAIPNCDIVTIEKDWTAASYFYEVVALNPDLFIRMSGLYGESAQGDSAVKVIFDTFGVDTQQGEQNVELMNIVDIEPTMEYDFTNVPDLFPATAVTCAALGVDARLTGLSNLHKKESDRVEAVREELEKMGARIEMNGDEMHLLPSELKVTQPVCAHGDHRIAMAFGALKVKYPEIEIDTPEVVAKSFPAFWEMLDRTINIAPELLADEDEDE